jgi:hypothetical protein
MNLKLCFNYFYIKWYKFFKHIKPIYNTIIYVFGTVFFWTLISISLFGGKINFNVKDGILIRLITFLAK